MDYLITPFTLLINVIFQFITFIFIFRVLLRINHLAYVEPFWGMVDRFTGVIVNPLRKIIPDIRCLETATLLIVYLLTLIKLIVRFSLEADMFPQVFGLLLWGLGDVILQFINVYFFLIIFNAILSWLQRGYMPAISVIAEVCEPLLRPIRKVIPLLGGFDISPLIALLGLSLLQWMLIEPFILFATRLAAV